MTAAARRLDDEEAGGRALFRPLEPIGPGPVLLQPTDWCRSPWDPGMLHGGPVGGLAGWGAERLVADRAMAPQVSAEPATAAEVGRSDRSGPAADGLLCTRLTVELLRPVPMAPLAVAATVVKRGRRSAVVDVSIEHEGRPVARAGSQWVVPSTGWDTVAGPVPDRPADVARPGEADIDYPRPGFNCDATELRYLSGSNEESGPAVIWTRLTSPLIAGQPVTPLVRLATVADLAAAAGFERGPDEEAFINPDLTIQLQRYPVGEWLALDARTHRSAGGVGFNEATVFDDRGPIGRILQSLVESPHDPAL